MTPEAAERRLPQGAEVPTTTWVRAFFDEAGHALWHAESAWSVLPDGWDQRAWRGGWLSGSEASLARWEERPGEMAARWREGEVNTALRHTDFGWHLRRGVLFWPAQRWDATSDDSEGAPHAVCATRHRSPTSLVVGSAWRGTF